MSAAKEDGEKKGKKGPPVMIIVVVAVVLGLVMGKMFLGGSKAEAKGSKEKKPVAEVGISLSLDEFLVNLTGGGDHYLRTSVALGLKKGLTEEEMKEHTAPLRDGILTVLSTKTFKELSTPKVREEMKEEIKKKLNEELGDDKIVKVYFTTFATQ